MELKYSVTQKLHLDTCHLSQLSKSSVASAVSCQNVLAFIRINSRPDTIKHKIPIYTVCVADLNTIHEPHMIFESLECITHLKFSSCGKQLLVVTRPGTVMMFIKGAALNHWTKCHTSQWHGEDVLHIDFFHMGVKPTLQTSDVKISAQYSDKFALQPHKATLTNFINTPVPGFYALGASGILLICVMNSKYVCVEQKEVVLGKMRSNLTVAAVAQGPSGMLHIAAWKPEVVKCWNVELSYLEKEEKLQDSLQVKIYDAHTLCPAPSTDPKISTASAWRAFTPKPGCITTVIKLLFPEIEDPTNLLVVLSVENNTTDPASTTKQTSVNYYIQRYHLQERSHSVLQLFSNGKANNSSIKEWICLGEWQSSGVEIVEVGSSLRQLLPTSQMPYLITVATTDGSIYSINKDTMSQVNTFSLHNIRSVDEPTSTKKQAVSKYAVSLVHTWTGLSVVAVDNHGSIYFISLLKSSDVGQVWLMHIIILLELSLISGHDWFDLLITIPQTSILTVTDRLSQVFNQHPFHIIHQFNTRFLVMKNSLFRLSTTFLQKSIETRLQAQLLAILRLFRSVRPVTNDVYGNDKNVAMAVQNFIENRASLEQLEIDKAIDQLLSTTNILDCQVDPNFAKDHQALLQYTADLALYLILMLAQNTKHEPSRDTKVLTFIREILLISRIWHHHSRLVVPQMFRKTDAVDVWAQLYKLLTRLCQILPGEPDVTFLDECILLETQVVSREIPLYIPPRGVLGQINSNASPSHPLQFHFDVQETQPLTFPGGAGRPLEGALPAPQLVDPLFNHFLGAPGPSLQNCTRCWGIRGNWWNDGDSLWEQQWSNICQCSGHWGPTTATKTTNVA